MLMATNKTGRPHGRPPLFVGVKIAHQHVRYPKSWNKLIAETGLCKAQFIRDAMEEKFAKLGVAYTDTYK
jgi:hypothetical protein